MGRRAKRGLNAIFQQDPELLEGDAYAEDEASSASEDD
jgi:hypothetical protein